MRVTIEISLSCIILILSMLLLSQANANDENFMDKVEGSTVSISSTSLSSLQPTFSSPITPSISSQSSSSVTSQHLSSTVSSLFSLSVKNGDKGFGKVETVSASRKNVYEVNIKDSVILKCPLDVNKMNKLAKTDSYNYEDGDEEDTMYDDDDDEEDTADTDTENNDDELTNNESDDLENQTSVLNKALAKSLSNSKSKRDLQSQTRKQQENESNLENNEAKSANNDDELVFVQWYKDSVRISKFTYSPRFSINGLHLSIKDVNSNDAGNYRCKLVNGFGSSTASLNLVVKRDNLKVANQTELEKKSKIGSEEQEDEHKLKGYPPVFISQEKMQPKSVKKVKGSQIRFKCRAHAQPRADIIWFKNGQVLNEEDYGITRSRWNLDLKDLRLSDNGNFTCQVFNKYGYINATYELIVYEDSQIFDGLDPVNSTLIAGMDAVFNCRIKSSVPPNIKWMKQISKTEYANYVLQTNNAASNNHQSGSASSSDSLNALLDDDTLRNFYVMSTLSPLSFVDEDENQQLNEKSKKLDTYYDSKYLDDLFLGDVNSNNRDNIDLNAKTNGFKFYVPNTIENKKLKKNNKVEKSSTDNDDSVHYITISSSPTVEQKTIFNSNENIYVSQLIVKQASVKDSGIYVCFGGSSDGYSYKKSYLNVLPSKLSSSIDLISAFKEIQKSNYLDKQNPNYLNAIKSLNNKQAESQSSTYKPAFKSTISSSSLQSFGLLFVFIPVSFITLFAVISICYLKKLNAHKKRTISLTMNKNEENYESNCNPFRLIKFWVFSCESVNTNKKTGSGTVSSCWCCPSNKQGHSLIKDNLEILNETNKKCKKKKRNPQRNFSTNTVSSKQSSSENGLLPCAIGSLGSSSLSDSSSTTATTVAYYATIPLLIDNSNHMNTLSMSSPPPPLPNSQPPSFSSNTNKPATIYKPKPQISNNLNNVPEPGYNQMNENMMNNNLERSISTPSMAYYKIVDSELIQAMNKKEKNDENSTAKAQENRFDDDASTCVSSRFYYNLAPTVQVISDNNNSCFKNTINPTYR